MPAYHIARLKFHGILLGMGIIKEYKIYSDRGWGEQTYMILIDIDQLSESFAY